VGEGERCGERVRISELKEMINEKREQMEKKKLILKGGKD
jgi:hypothetical protein